MALPQPPPDIERFFRAQGAVDPSLIDRTSLVPPGSYWTKDLGSAYRYQAEAPDRRVMFVDIPKSDLFRQGILGNDYEVKMPPEFTQRFNPRYLDELSDAVGDRGAASLRGIAPMLSLPIMYAGNQLGVPEPLTRAAAGAAALSPLGVPGMLGGAALGGLSSLVPENSLVGQMIGSIL